jgi:hypothetical protein
MNDYFTLYFDIKRRWTALVRSTSQTVVRNILNLLIQHNHLLIFDPNEFCDLSDFGGLQQNLVDGSLKQIAAATPELERSILELRNLISELENWKHSLPDAHSTLLHDVAVVYEFFLKEFRVKETIVRNLTEQQYVSVPHDVIITISLLWQKSVYIESKETEIAESKFDVFASSQAPEILYH